MQLLLPKGILVISPQNFTVVQAAQILVGLAQSADPWFVDSQELRLFISPLGESPLENRNGQTCSHAAL